MQFHCENGAGITRTQRPETWNIRKSCAHVSFKSGSETFSIRCSCEADTAALRIRLAALGVGCFLVLTPPPSKSDQFGIVWGALPMYVPFDPTDPLNAAVLIRDLLVAHPPPHGREATTPLFRTDSGVSWTKRQLDSALSTSLARVCTLAERNGLTLHSFRVALACQLLEAGASPGQIQALLRWQTSESLRLYARMTDRATAMWLKKAQSAIISTSNTARMPVIDGWQSIDALQAAMDTQLVVTA